MAYSAEQLKVIREIRSEARRRYANDPAKRRRYEMTAYTIGRVESGFVNVKGGDADSTNWRQERASIYGGDQSITRSVRRVFDEMEQHDRGQKIGELAADVQRPRADLRGKYGLHVDEARKLAGGGSATPMTQGRVTQGRAPRLVPGGTTTDHKGAMLAAVLDRRKGMSLLDRFKYQVSTGQYTTTTPTTVKPGKMPQYSAGAPSTEQRGGQVAAIEAEANRIDRAQVPYLWGGGHAGKQARGSKVTPLDCSGAVSRILGINPRVASEFKKWGKPGRGKDFTVYARSDHVLVEIGGHFWGTSKANPGGGAGWIPRGKISAAYIRRFKARHL